MVLATRNAIRGRRLADLRNHQASSRPRPRRPRAIPARHLAVSGLRTRHRQVQSSHRIDPVLLRPRCVLHVVTTRSVSAPDVPSDSSTAVLVLIGVVRSFNGPVSRAILPQLVPEEHFPSAVAWSSSVFQTGTILGPALGGVTYAAFHGPAAVYGAAASAGDPRGAHHPAN